METPFSGPQEQDPIAHDQDSFVHPDETMADGERALADKYPVEAYDGDISDEYWADYEALYPEASATNQTEIHEHDKDENLVVVVTPSGVAVTMRKESLEDYEGMTDQEIGEAIDKEIAEEETQHEGRDAIHDSSENDGYDDDTEDPLAGDVDSWVSEDETR